MTPTADQKNLIARGVRLCGYGVTAARLGLASAVSALVRLGALAPARALVKIVSRGGLRREDEGILAPIWKLPPQSRRMLRQAWTQPRFFEALGSQIASICASAEEGAPRRSDGPMCRSSSCRPRVQTNSACALTWRLRGCQRRAVTCSSLTAVIGSRSTHRTLSSMPSWGWCLSFVAVEQCRRSRDDIGNAHGTLHDVESEVCDRSAVIVPSAVTTRTRSRGMTAPTSSSTSRGSGNPCRSTIITRGLFQTGDTAVEWARHQWPRRRAPSSRNSAPAGRARAIRDRAGRFQAVGFHQPFDQLRTLTDRLRPRTIPMVDLMRNVQTGRLLRPGSLFDQHRRGIQRTFEQRRVRFSGVLRRRRQI